MFTELKRRISAWMGRSLAVRDGSLTAGQKRNMFWWGTANPDEDYKYAMSAALCALFVIILNQLAG